MSLAQAGGGPVTMASAYLSKVHPVFMLPPIAAAAFGAIIAGAINPPAAAVHILAIFCSVYTAHLKDTYIDYHVRGEDDTCPLTRRGCWAGIIVASLVMAGCLVLLYQLVDLWAVALTAPGWFIGYLHAPHLDTNPVTTTVGYPTGIALAIIGGYYIQVASLSIEVVAISLVFLVLLSGVKIVDDLQDYEWDLANHKRSAGVVLGFERAHSLAIWLMGSTLGGVIILGLFGVIEPSSSLAAGVFAPILIVARKRDPRLGTMLLIRGSYLFLAVLVAAAWWRPLG